ncbi:outer membrane lipoprotein carrier protein LolA [Luteolibacter pohnpeiensis]|uniref:Outer membrane lipoprotein carrier protein LolA n=1 Tax=Luteolibacter pohnpeiensis TaxID=454153 RepID=A0A934S909_9BACT|nr:outer-membrane lipoprotein carrier protein LolA [Luteolibacter pohnpeiensis]MBK1881043.1 outer membrane lipoprotein carrier protein LolA [Luteolibacter pohnpeiensis]
MRSLLCSIVLIASAHAQDAVLQSWLEHQAEVKSLDATFTQERKLPALKNPVVTPGRISFQKPDKIRWQLGEPTETLAVSDGKTLTMIEEADKTARQIPADSPRAARFTALTGSAFANPTAFTDAFEIVEKRVTLGIHQYTLKPKDRKFRSQVPWVFIDIDPEKNELRAFELELKDKSRLRTVFHNPKFNQVLPDSLFTPDLTGYSVK